MDSFVIFPLNFSKEIYSTEIFINNEGKYKSLDYKQIIDHGYYNYYDLFLNYRYRHSSLLQIYGICNRPDFSKENTQMEININKGIKIGCNQSNKFDVILEPNKGYLLSYLIKENKLTIKEKLIILLNIADTIEYFHEMNVILGYLSPDKIVIKKDYSIKIVDFRVTNNNLNVIRDNYERSYRYMAPESLEIKNKSNGILHNHSFDKIYSKSITNKIDTWSFGCIAYEVLSGIKPWSHIKNEEKIGESLFFLKKFEISKSIPIIIRRFLEKCIIIDPSSRVTIKEAKFMLQKILFENIKNLIKENDFTRNFYVALQNILVFLSHLNPNQIYHLLSNIMTHLFNYFKRKNNNLNLNNMEKFKFLINENNDLNKLNLEKSNYINNLIISNQNLDSSRLNSNIKISLEDNSTNVNSNGVSCLKEMNSKSPHNISLLLKDDDLTDDLLSRLKSPLKISTSLPLKKALNRKVSFNIEPVRNNLCEGSEGKTDHGDYNLKRFKISIIDHQRNTKKKKMEMINLFNFDIIEHKEKTSKDKLFTATKTDILEIKNNLKISEKKKKKKKKKKNIQEFMNSLQIVNLYSFNIISKSNNHKQSKLISQMIDEININTSRNRTHLDLKNLTYAYDSFRSDLKEKNILTHRVNSNREKVETPKILKVSNMIEEKNEDPFSFKARNLFEAKDKFTKLYFNVPNHNTPNRNKSETNSQKVIGKKKKEIDKYNKIFVNTTMKSLLYNFSNIEKHKIKDILNEDNYRSNSKKKEVRSLINK